MKLSKVDEAMVAQGWIPAPLAAEKMGKHLATVHRLIQSGTLDSTKSGGRWFVSAKSCIEYLGPVAAKALGLVKDEQKPKPAA